MNADIGISNIVPLIIDSTTDYLVVFMPLFLLIAGIVLAVVVITLVLRSIYGVKDDNDDVL